MKKFIYFFLFFLVSLAANSQVQRPANTPSPNSPTGYSLYGYVRADSGFIWKQRDTFPAKFPTIIWHTNGNFYKTNGNGGAWSLFVSGTASTVSSVSGNAPISVANGTTTPTISVDTSYNGLTTKKWLYKSVDSLGFLKLNISDTAAMLLSRLKVSDTAYMLSGYLRESDTSAMLSNYVPTFRTIGTNAPLFGGGNLSANRTLGADTGRNSAQLVTGGSLTAVKDSLVALIASSGGGTVLSVATTDGYGVVSSVADPTSTPNISLRVDTVSISTRAWRQKGIDSVQANLTAGLALKLNLSDTAAMLSNRLKISDTASMLLPFVQYSDTSNMLSPYRRTTTKITNSDLVNSTISGISLGSNLADLTFGQYLQVGASSYNGSAATTITTNGTSTNAGSTLVARDVNGDFSARNISATQFLGTASSASTVAITNDITTNATYYPMFSTVTTGSTSTKVSSSKLTYNPSTGMLSSTGFTGALTGNASTATVLQTPRTINGVAFDGSANISISASVDSSLSAGYGILGSPFDGSLGRTWVIDTSNISTKANVVGSLVAKLNISDTASMLSKYFRTTTQLNDTTFVINRPDATADTIQLSFLVPDTTGKLSIIDTSAMLAPYRRTSTKITNSDLANSTISGIALGSNLNNLTAGNGLSGTAYNGGTAYTWQVDTSTISTKANVTGLLVGYATTGDNALKLNISDTASMLANRLRISDTATMLTPFVQYSDTASIVAGYVRSLRFTDSLTNVQSRIQSKLAITDTAAMLAGYTRLTRFTDSLTAVQARIQTKQPLGAYITLADSTTILAGRWLPNRSADSIAVIRALANSKGTGSVTSVATGVGLSGGTITTSGTISADTTTLSTRAYVTGALVGYATTGNLALKLNISDTATMLSNYRRTSTLIQQSEVSGLSTSLAAKLNISDTATMLSGYKTYYPRTAISAGTGISYNAATGVITNSSPSSGGTVTSVATSAPITGGTITSTGTIGITQSTRTTDGYLSSTDWNTFNNKASTESVALKLNISDTATMLSNYRRKTTLIENADLRNSAITINGSSTSLGGSINVGTVTSVAASAGTGISVSGSPITSSGTLTITNTAPDQTVTLTSGTGISVTGTYPNFTVTNTSPSSGGTVTSVTASAPLSSSGGTTPNITISQATTSTNGFLTSTDWNTFNDKASTASVALKLNISDTAAMMSKSFRTTTQVNDTTFTINRPDGTKDTIALSVQVPSTSQLVYNTALTTDADYSLGLSDTYVQLVSTSTPRTLTLPAASTCLGRVVILNSKVGGGSGWTSTQTIYTTYPTTGGVTSLNGSVDTIISNGTNWIFLTRY